MHLAYLHYLTDDDMALHHVRQFADAARGLGHRVDVHAMNFRSEAMSDEWGAMSGGRERSEAMSDEWGATSNGRERSEAMRDAGRATGGGRERLEAMSDEWGAMSGGRSRQSHRSSLIARRLLRYWLHEPKELAWNARYVRAELARLRGAPPDVLLVRDHLLTASCVPVARRLGLPLVLEVNAPAVESRLYLDQYAHLPWVPEWLEGWKLRRADAVTVVSTPLKQHLVGRCGVAAARVAVCPNGADVERFHAGVTPDAALRGAGPLVGFVGSFQKWHGTALLAAVIRAVAAARAPVRFALIGDGPERGALQAALADLGTRVQFTGTLPHARLPALVAGLDVGLLPEADFYRCPLKLVEWMAAGRAIVAPAYAPIGELIRDGVEGVLVPPRDAAAMTRAVIALCDDAARRAALGAAAAARVRRELTWTDTAARVLAACEQARAAHRAAAATAGEACVGRP
ncbi:MAG: glycosyltransferase family 4 protein [Deltaproteobacteria bacterium]|nr:glycosyltransferase family 4 protein [Deltaproteobacteria bacterium]